MLVIKNVDVGLLETLPTDWILCLACSTSHIYVCGTRGVHLLVALANECNSSTGPMITSGVGIHHHALTARDPDLPSRIAAFTLATA